MVTLGVGDTVGVGGLGVGVNDGVWVGETIGGVGGVAGIFVAA